MLVAATLLAGCSSTPSTPSASSASLTASGTATFAAPTEPAPPSAPAPATHPLTGLAATGAPTRPALMVKIDNVGGALPQTGVPMADIVFEEPVEGGLTRLVAVFNSVDPGVVGPIRSARPIDAQIARMLGNSILMFSGASRYEIRPVKRDSNATLIADDWSTAPGTFERNPDKSGDHTLFGSATKAWAWAARHKTPDTAPNQPFAFSDTGSASAVPTKDVSIRFDDTHVEWAWSASKSVWKRSQNGSPHEDTESGQLTADTVVILSVPISYDPQLHDVLGNPTPVVSLEGTGTVWLLRDGTKTRGTWSRANIDAPLVLTDASGAVLGVKPGHTWVEILPQPAKPE